jgi:hypothetical protein
MTRPVSPVRTAWRYSAAPLGQFGRKPTGRGTHRSTVGVGGRPALLRSRSSARHPIFARFYARVSPRMERAGTADCRHALLAGLTGRVIAVGVSLVLCSVVDLPTPQHELHGVIKPGGELRFFEHVRADTPRPAPSAAARRRNHLASPVRRLPRWARRCRHDRGRRLHDPNLPAVPASRRCHTPARCRSGWGVNLMPS